MNDYAETVRLHHQDTVAYLLAEGDPCVRIRDDEVARINRRLVPISWADLETFAPSGSWLLAVILCEGDDMTGVTTWALSRPEPDAERIRFYLHPAVDAVRAFRPWYRAGLDDPRATVVDDWRSLHPVFGKDLNDRVYRDAAGHRR